jgi:hypothetical protein
MDVSHIQHESKVGSYHNCVDLDTSQMGKLLGERDEEASHLYQTCCGYMRSQTSYSSGFILVGVDVTC